ncbi:MAG: hypothetical protein NT023_23000 [Armatimonadetes bacterium]|nr:hypothetical protein [Armatimonadota bacterium]
MKKQVSPVAVGIVIAVALVAIIFFFMKSSGSPSGNRPTAAQANSGPSIGGKHFPGAAGAGGGGGGATPGGGAKGGE